MRRTVSISQVPGGLNKTANETNSSLHGHQGRIGMGISGGAYGMVFIGAMVYYFQHATTF